MTNASTDLASSIAAAIAGDDVMTLAQLASQPGFKQAIAQPDINGRTGLHNAVAAGNVDAALFLLDTRHANPNTADNQGETPLLRAAWLGSQQMVEALVAAGADLGARSNTGGGVLHHAYAGSTQSQPLVDRLIALGADPAVTDKQGAPPQDWTRQAETREAGEQMLATMAKRQTLRLSR